MKVSQILYIFLFLALIVVAVKSTHLLDGFEDIPQADPVIAQGLKEARVDIQVQPNSSVPGTLPVGPYAQTASVGSYQYQDPAQLPAELKQMQNLQEDMKAFLVFEGPSIGNSSDPTVSLPLTQIQADSRKLQQEISVLERNPGIQSSLNQQELADMQEGLTFLQRKVRLFQTSGVVSDSNAGKEGFANPPIVKTKASKPELQLLQTKVMAAILTLSSSKTTDPVVQARIKILQSMYTDVSNMISKLNKGIWTATDVPVYSEDIKVIIPNLADPKKPLMSLTEQESGRNLNPIEKAIAGLVGEENVSDVFKGLKDNGTFKVSFDLGYNVLKPNFNSNPSANPYSNPSPNTSPSSSTPLSMNRTVDLLNLDNNGQANPSMNTIQPSSSSTMNGPYDNTMSGMDDRAEAIQKANRPSHLDWKARTKGICDQIKLRGLDPLDFGCIPEGSRLSPAYSWRGHAKMVCGRLGSTMDPGLPQTCGCPPPNWKGWTLPDCLSGPAPMGSSDSDRRCK
jgi:hypothetical protein